MFQTIQVSQREGVLGVMGRALALADVGIYEDGFPRSQIVEMVHSFRNIDGFW
jgi:hypothetical protein